MLWYATCFFFSTAILELLASILIIERSCYRRLQIGKRLHDRYIRHSLPCDTIQACQHQCSVEQHFDCQGFNIRLDEAGLGRGVCELTSVSVGYLDYERDFQRDSEFDFYEKDLSNASPNCGYMNEVVSVVPKRDDAEGGRSMPPNDGSVYPPWKGRGEGGQMPWSSGQGGGPRSGVYPPPNPPHHFGGGSLRPVSHPNEIPNYGYRPPKDHDYNTKDWAHGRSMSFGRPGDRLPGYVIVEADSNRPHSRQNPEYPAFPQDFNPGPSDNFHGWNYGQNKQQVCFQRMAPANRMRPSMIREQHRTSGITHCEDMCSSATSFRCMGYTFRYSGTMDRESNCYLTHYATIHPISDLVQDRDYDFYYRSQTCQSIQVHPETDCFIKEFIDTAFMLNIIRAQTTASSRSECELDCLRADSFICRSFTYRTQERNQNCWLSDWPLKELTPAQLVPLPGSFVYERGSFGRGCELDIPNYPNTRPHPTDVIPGRPQQPRQWNRDAWQHFTVRGWPCRRGTQCALNRDAGFWSCEVEGGDHTQWDYCCRPQHACGYSKGFRYPWCYVGEAGADQWRPCSDHFYPSYGESQSSVPDHVHHHTHGSYESEFGPPSAWPISYLYSKPPPNETVYFEPQEPVQSHYEELSPSYYGDSPMIQFKPSAPSSYPKAIIQKLDIKDSMNSDVPNNSEDVKILNINPRNNYAKKIKEIDPPKYVFASTGLKNSSDTQLANFIQGTTLAEFMSSIPYVNDSVASAQINKTKQILEQIEKIIANSTKEAKETNCTAEGTESLESIPSDGIGFARGFFNTTQSLFLKEGDNAMSRFWNWGQENYYTKDSKT